MPVAQCQQCGEGFWRESNETWKKLCYHCWKEKQEQNHVLLRQRLASLEDDLESKDSLIASLDGLIEYQEKVIAYLKEQLCEADGCLDLFRQYNRFLLLACHPDRNPAHAETATVVTQALLDLRRQARQPSCG